jgi:hypothetical protein
MADAEARQIVFAPQSFQRSLGPIDHAQVLQGFGTSEHVGMAAGEIGDTGLLPRTEGVP